MFDKKSVVKKPKYYDWNKTLSYDADVTMVIGARGIGKTYGIRLQGIRDYINNGYRFVEIVRYKTELQGVIDGYFNRIETNEEFSGYIFKTQGQRGYIAKKPEENGDEKVKPKWEVLCYFIPMTQHQQIKKRTFDRVKRIIFDEAILDKKDRFHNYLSKEYSILANIVDTVSRERPDVKSVKPHIYLLGNALDILNPYFLAYKVGVPKPGFKWYKNKTFLLHYIKDEEYSEAKKKDTVAGRMLEGFEDSEINNNNMFVDANDDFIMEKTKVAKFSFGVMYNHYTFGVWVDWNNGYYFVNKKIPNNTTQPVYTITLDDNRMNYIAARRAEKILKDFAEMHYYGIIRYDSIETRELFKEVLVMFGVR